MAEAKREMDPIAKKRAAMYERALEVYNNDHESAQLWISTPLDELDGRPPVALVSSEEEVLRVMQILDRIDYGIYA